MKTCVVDIKDRQNKEPNTRVDLRRKEGKNTERVRERKYKGGKGEKIEEEIWMKGEGHSCMCFFRVPQKTFSGSDL